MTKLYLHIGTEKTGTTYIQKFLKQNREKLFSRGYFVPNFMGGMCSHYWLPILVYEKNKQDDLTNIVKIYTKDDPESIIKLKIDELKKAVQINKDKDWIISSEHLHARLNKMEIRRLKSLLQPLFNEIKIIVYLRDPLESTISLWSTAVKVGWPIKKIPSPGNTWDYICNHKRTIQLWEENFKEKITPKLYCKRSFYKGNLIEDFLAQIGIKLDTSFEIPENVNQSMSYAGIRVLSHINEIIPPAKIGLFDPLRGNIKALIIEAYKDFPTYYPTEKEIYTYEKYYEESNKWIKNKYFPEKESLWERKQKIAENDYQTLFKDKEIHAISKLISNLLIKKGAEISDLKKEIDDLKKEMNDLKNQVKFYQEQMLNYEKSSIWKLSKPLRNVADLVKRFSGKN